MSNQTPAPWYIEQDDDSHDLIINDAPSNDIDRSSIALVYADGIGSELPNASLISASPSLLRTLLEIANYRTSDEGDRRTTENEFGLNWSEIVEMAHDEIIVMAREAVLLLAIQHSREA